MFPPILAAELSKCITRFASEGPLFIDKNLKRMEVGGYSCLNTGTFVLFYCNSPPTSNHWKEKLHPLQGVLVTTGVSWGSTCLTSYLANLMSLWGSERSLHHYLSSTHSKKSILTRPYVRRPWLSQGRELSRQRAE